jgi:hypothetical protein
LIITKDENPEAGRKRESPKEPKEDEDRRLYLPSVSLPVIHSEENA